MLRHERRAGRASQLPPVVRGADALAVGLAVLTVFVLFHPIRFTAVGILIRIQQWWRVALLASVIVVFRHWWRPHPSLLARMVAGAGRILEQIARAALGKRAPLLLAMGVPAIVIAAILSHGYDGVTYLRGDCPYYYWTALALLKGHGLDISSELPGGWQHHINQVALSIGNTSVPKHPVVMPILSLPFIGAFDKPGALVFNVVQMGTLLLVLYRLACSVARPYAASAAVVFTFVGSMLPHYVWNYSPDVCATVLLMSGTLVVSIASRFRGWLAGGFLLGAAAVAKFPLIVFLPGAVLLIQKPNGKSMVPVASGIAVPLAAFAMMNIHLFGSPFVTSYDRIATLKDGNVPAVYSERSSFDQPIGVGARRQVFDQEHGLLTTSPVTLLALVGVPLLMAQHPRFGAHLVLGSVALFLLFSMYDQWDASHYGNRFLIPAVAAFTVPLAVSFDWIAGRLAARRVTVT